jgi:hypothetical protein
LRLIGGSGDLDCQGHDVQSVELTDVHGLTIRNCRMQGFSSTRSSGVTLVGNVLTADTRKTVGTVVRFADGTNNKVIDNTIDGSWRGQKYPFGGYPPGADDGIIIENDANLLIEGNVIRNIWDCGIERLGNRTDPITIRNNDITNAADCGLGGWFSGGRIRSSPTTPYQTAARSPTSTSQQRRTRASTTSHSVTTCSRTTASSIRERACPR